MNRKDIVKAFKCIGNEVVDNLPEILAPFVPYGKSIGVLVKSIRDGAYKLSEEEAKNQAKRVLKNTLKETENPKFMDNVLFTCKEGYSLTEEQQEDLASILQREFSSGNEADLALINEFIEQYMGGHIDVDNVDECSIGKDYISFNFSTYAGEDEFPYDENDLKLIMNSLNGLLGVEAFDYYIADGHIESWNE